MRKGLSFIFICLMLLSFLGEAFHHHDDGNDHPKRAVCVATQQKSDAGFSFAPLEAPGELAGTLSSPSIITFAGKPLYTPSLGRAPPA